MATATATVHWKNGLWAQDGGVEYPLVLAAVAFAVTAIGAGRYSLDNLFGIDWSSLTWAIVASLVGIAGGLAAVAIAHVSHDHETHGAQPHAA
jgi:putative oxidoreductase